ncbi:MAG: hypothetical protein ABI822_12245 [Bryobacteraceae bacterium]
MQMAPRPMPPDAKVFASFIRSPQGIYFLFVNIMSPGIAQTPAAGLGDPVAIILQRYAGTSFEVSYPAGWETYGSGDDVIFAPPGGLSSDANGENVIHLGILVHYETSSDLRKLSLERYTDEFLKQCCRSFPDYRMEHQEVSRDQTAMDTTVSAIAADGNRSVNRLVTMRLPDAFVAMVLAVPANQAKAYFQLFAKIIGTLGPAQNSQRPTARQ